MGYGQKLSGLMSAPLSQVSVGGSILQDGKGRDIIKTVYNPYIDQGVHHLWYGELLDGVGNQDLSSLRKVNHMA